jgi:hypothetical protein
MGAKLVEDSTTDDFFEIVRQVLIPMFYKETQLGRSLRGANPELKRELFESITELANKADNKNLRNEDIRRKIVEISGKARVSIGQTQKLVNVYLKYYCILTKKPTEIIKELDCPLDSRVMSKFRTEDLRKVPLKEMTQIEDYIAWQAHLEKIGEGVRLKPDIQAYDTERIRLFFKS